jgi:hypothetical protein
MVQAAVHQVVGVIAVRDRFVAAAGAMLVAASGRLACGGVGPTDVQGVLIAVVAMLVMQVAVVQVVDMVAVLDGHVAAALAMLVSVPGVGVTRVRHGVILLLGTLTSPT